MSGPGPYDLTTHDGRRVDWLTKRAIEAAESLLGYPLSITQGSYNASRVPASAGTHDGGGVVDLKAWDGANKVRALRRVGFAAWYRDDSEGPWPDHIHAVQIGNQRLSTSAARQVDAYLAGRNGLANNGPDNGPRDYINARFAWTEPKEEDDDMTPDQVKQAFREVLDEPRYKAYGEDAPPRKFSHVVLRMDHGVRKLLARDFPTAREVATEVVAQLPADQAVDQAVVEAGVAAFFDRLTEE